MSIQWRIHASTHRSKDEVRSFLSTLPGAGQSSQFPERRGELVEFRGCALASFSIPESSGVVEKNLGIYGFRETLCITFNPVRGSDRTGFRETVYEVAFDFAKWDETCDIYFSEDERGIFTRRGGHLLINPRQFDAAELRELLPASYATADPPEHALQKAGWPPGM